MFYFKIILHKFLCHVNTFIDNKLIWTKFVNDDKLCNKPLQTAERARHVKIA
jgi:hypothetical protein